MKRLYLLLLILLALALTAPACNKRGTPTAVADLGTSEPVEGITATSTEPIPSPTAISTFILERPFTPTPIPSLTPAHIVHVVQEGETLSRIASRYDVSLEKLIAANSNLVNPNLIRVGQELIIPHSNATLTPLPSDNSVPTESHNTESAHMSYEFALPIEVRSSEGWIFTINQIDSPDSIADSIDGFSRRYEPENGTFLVMIGTVSNYSDRSGCIYGTDFILVNDAERYEMSQQALSAAKNVYKLDYPGFFFGQCLDYQETVGSILVFDTSMGRTDLRLEMKDAEISLPYTYR